MNEKIQQYDSELLQLVKKFIRDQELTEEEKIRWLGKVF